MGLNYIIGLVFAITFNVAEKRTWQSFRLSHKVQHDSFYSDALVSKILIYSRVQKPDRLFFTVEYSGLCETIMMNFNKKIVYELY